MRADDHIVKCFNTEGACIPSKHYMVNIDERLKCIEKLVDAGKYFTINRARQYGKTTTLKCLEEYLSDKYYVISLDFQTLGNASFATEDSFVKAFVRRLLRTNEKSQIPDDIIKELTEIKDSSSEVFLDELFDILSDWCKNADKGIVLMIDEIDSASDSIVFLDFLAQLRAQYIAREGDSDDNSAFKSVILAGVTDVKHLRSKVRDEDQSKVNSPWNIAVELDVDMSLSARGIESMLDEYAVDHDLNIDAINLARIIRDYTNGYPYLVSRICQIIDQKLSTETDMFSTPEQAWTEYGIEEAVKIILNEKSTLFDSLTGKLTNSPSLKNNIFNILMNGATISYNPDQEDLSQMCMYGFINPDNGVVRISNRIFETRLYNLFLSDEEFNSNKFSESGSMDKNIFIHDGKLDMVLVMEHFISTYKEVMGPLEDKYKEKDARRLFLLYLKPIINGTGNYYIEAQTRDQKRTDVIVDYLGERYVIELKIWHGDRYNQKGEKQISEYLDYFNLNVGYMLSFNFNKNKDESRRSVERVNVGDKILYEGMV